MAYADVFFQSLGSLNNALAVLNQQNMLEAEKKKKQEQLENRANAVGMLLQPQGYAPTPLQQNPVNVQQTYPMTETSKGGIPISEMNIKSGFALNPKAAQIPQLSYNTQGVTPNRFGYQDPEILSQSLQQYLANEGGIDDITSIGSMLAKFQEKDKGRDVSASDYVTLGNGNFGFVNQNGSIADTGIKSYQKTDVGDSYNIDELDTQGNPLIVDVDNIKYKKVKVVKNGQVVGYSYQKVDDNTIRDPNINSVKISALERFNSDANVKKQQQMIDFADVMDNILSSNNPIGDNAIPTFMARASGEVGNLSEADKQPFGGSSAIDMKLKRFFERQTEGALDETDRAFVRDLVSTFRKSAGENIRRLAKYRAKQYSRGIKGLDPKELESMFNPDDNEAENLEYDNNQAWEYLGGDKGDKNNWKRRPDLDKR